MTKKAAWFDYTSVVVTHEDRGQREGSIVGTPRMTSLMWVCTGPCSRFCTTALAILVRWPIFPRLMPPAALKGKPSIKEVIQFRFAQLLAGRAKWQAF